MGYREYLEFCRETYLESRKKCQFVDLYAIIIGNIGKVSKGTIADGDAEDFINDIYLDIVGEGE